MFRDLSQMAVGPESITVTQGPTAPYNAPVHLPTLRSVFRRMIESVMKARERQAAERVARYLRERPEVRDNFRIELERPIHGPINAPPRPEAALVSLGALPDGLGPTSLGLAERSHRPRWRLKITLECDAHHTCRVRSA